MKVFLTRNSEGVVSGFATYAITEGMSGTHTQPQTS